MEVLLPEKLFKHRRFEEVVARRLIPNLRPPYRKDAQVYVDCIPKLYTALATKREGSDTAAYLVKYLHDDWSISFNLLIALELAGFMRKIKIQHPINAKWKQTLYQPTDKLLYILTEGTLPESLKYPILLGLEIPSPEVRRGIAQKVHYEVIEGISQTVFEVNHFIADIIPQVMDVHKDVMAHRAVETSVIVGHDKFRFPYFLDCRGRTYCDVTVGVNPQGSNYEKAMCIPSHREVLSPGGLMALLSHADSQSECPTLTALPPEAKAYAYATAAANALTDRGWMDWDKPFYGLAVAQTIREYLTNPDAPINSFVERDGKCSGLQHWSALLRTNAITNRLGMEVLPAEDGMDIYEYVAYRWRETLEEEYKKYGIRKTAKKTVMTFAYSATRMSSMDNMRDLYPELDIKISSALGSSMFNVSNEILQPMVAGVDWLKECVRIITEKGHYEIQWPTPDGFMARQSYTKKEFTQVKVIVRRKSFTVDCKDDIIEDGRFVPKLSKAQLAIGPNIIHSLDATHLRMVAKRLNDMGLDSIWIHDSFAVHANYIPMLDKIIRQDFLALYSRNIMQELKEYWEMFYNVELPDHPTLGTWDVTTVMKCPKFFS